jgi:hypothetical protein
LRERKPLPLAELPRVLLGVDTMAAARTSPEGLVNEHRAAMERRFSGQGLAGSKRPNGFKLPVATDPVTGCVDVNPTIETDLDFLNITLQDD